MFTIPHHTMKAKIKSAFLAADGFQDQLIQELDGVLSCQGRLVLSERSFTKKPFWAQNCWHNPLVISIDSIADAAKKLKALQRNWNLYSFQLHRRAQLIQEQLPHVSCKPLSFPTPFPKASLGSWTLLDRDTVLAASDCSSAFPNGEPHFQEDKKNPPNRAYLKLWEALTRVQEYPSAGQFCIDVGSSPGGWTWVLAQLGAEVWSVDRSPLDERVARMPGIHFEKRDAFSLKPDELPRPRMKIDWLFSDLVCYPEKLFDWVMMWVDSGVCDNFICTLKFQGKGDYHMAQKFADIPDSQVLHLFNNKHELTWMKLKSWERSPVQG
ncbi:LSU rRNA 2'-O-methyl-C2498 methyltransferase RlmM [hydrothermal vent metagenome]|uniref:LSU rRNA 2'-O-methyl-C2498 methyltransferase RlmM n=1 Tax=hydrothermal vent metagenome TaxID=652676 RepID=A0A3B1D3Z1_9ZZZZ